MIRCILVAVANYIEERVCGRYYSFYTMLSLLAAIANMHIITTAKMGITITLPSIIISITYVAVTLYVALFVVSHGAHEVLKQQISLYGLWGVLYIVWIIANMYNINVNIIILLPLHIRAFAIVGVTELLRRIDYNFYWVPSFIEVLVVIIATSRALVKRA